VNPTARQVLLQHVAVTSACGPVRARRSAADFVALLLLAGLFLFVLVAFWRS
jgi:hypothetical protein